MAMRHDGHVSADNGLSGVATAAIQPSSQGPRLAGKLWLLIFHAHLLVAATIITFLALHGLPAHNRKLDPKLLSRPLLASVGSSVFLAATCLTTTLHHPAKALKLSLWLAPLIAFVVALLLLNTESGAGVGFAFIAIVVAIVQSLYACWVTPRLLYAGQILAKSLSNVRISFASIGITVLAVVVGVLFSFLLILGVVGAVNRPPRLAPLYVFILLASLTWTSNVIRYSLHVAISRAAYLHITTGVDPVNPDLAALRPVMGTIVLAATVMPPTVVVRGTARGMKLVAGDADEFLFSCTNCCLVIAECLVARANRWALVHVGVEGSGLLAASRRAWTAFEGKGMVRLVDSDLTGFMCFNCGVAGGAVCAMVGGVWMTVFDKARATGVAVYAFLVGYLMVRIAMSWPQGCVSAYLVAYAEDPRNPLFGPEIPNRITQLQSS